MPYNWEEIKEAIEKVESERLDKEFAELEMKEGLVQPRAGLMESSRIYINYLACFSLGLTSGIVTLIFNFLLFVYLLHLEF